MANIVVTKTGNSLIVAFNDYSSAVEADKRSYDCRDVVEIELSEGASGVIVMMRDAHKVERWFLTYDSGYVGTEKFIIDSIEGAAPTSESDLFDKLNALR